MNSMFFFVPPNPGQELEKRSLDGKISQEKDVSPPKPLQEPSD